MRPQHSADGLVMKQGPGFSDDIKNTWDIHVASPLEIFEAREPGRVGAGHDPKDLLEEGLVARDGQRALVAEPVLFLSFHQKLLEHWVVQVRRAHDEPHAARPHTHRHVPRWDIRRRRRQVRFLPPPE